MYTSPISVLNATVGSINSCQRNYNSNPHTHIHTHQIPNQVLGSLRKKWKHSLCSRGFIPVPHYKDKSEKLIHKWEHLPSLGEGQGKEGCKMRSSLGNALSQPHQFQASTGLICSQPNPLRSCLRVLWIFCTITDYCHGNKRTMWQLCYLRDQEQPLMGNTHHLVNGALCC